MTIKKLPKDLDEREVKSMFISASKVSKRDEKILKLLYYWGLRNSEMRMLKREHIDLDRLILKVVDGKGGKDRLLPILEEDPLSEDGLTVLDDLRIWMVAKKGGYLVRGESKGGSISDRWVQILVKRYAKRACVRNWESVTPHTLRHAYATHLVNMGVPIETVQKLLGHSKRDTTLIYVKMDVETVRRDVKTGFWKTKIMKDFDALIDKCDTSDKLLKFNILLSSVRLGIPNKKLYLELTNA